MLKWTRAQEHGWELDGGEALPELRGVEIDTLLGQVRTPMGRTTEVTTILASEHQRATGPWDGVQWKHRDSTLLSSHGTSITFALGRLRDSGRVLVYYDASQIGSTDGKVLGGLDGELRWTWLYVAHLWLPEALRGSGLGSARLARAESFAQEQGCTAEYLDTLEFQAPSFYLRHGYSTYGVLEGFPPGSRRYYFQKRLDGEPRQANT